jgi:hypothetical protein
MSTPSPRDFDSYCLLPTAAERLQGKTIEDQQETIEDQNKTIAELRGKPQHSNDEEDLDGKGYYGGSGVPGDLPSKDPERLVDNTPSEMSAMQAAKPSEPSHTAMPGDSFNYGGIAAEDRLKEDEEYIPRDVKPGSSSLQGGSNSGAKKRSFPRYESELAPDEEYPYYIGMYDFSDIDLRR